MNDYKKKETYSTNPNVKKPGIKIEYTEEQIKEYIKCVKDPIYFIRNYVKIISLDNGIIPFNMWDWQEELIRSYATERFVICKIGRQSGKTQTTSAYLLWCILFNDNYTAAILANKHTTAIEIVERIKLSYEMLPLWLQQGVNSWNRTSIELENGSRIISNSTSPAAIRGYAINCIDGSSLVTVMDEDDVVHEISIGELDELVRGWEVRDVVLQFDEDETGQVQNSSVLFREPSHPSIFPRRIGRAGEYDPSNAKGALPSSSSSSEDDNRKGEENYVVFSIQDDDRLAGRTSQTNGIGKSRSNIIDVASSIRTQDRFPPQRGNESSHVCEIEGKEAYNRNEGEDFSFADRKASRSFEDEGTRSEHIEGSDWSEEKSGSRSEDKFEPRKDTQDRREAPWNEKDGGKPVSDEGCSERPYPLEQRIKEGSLRVLTADGWKRFKGIKRTSSRSTITLRYNDGRSITCTPTHLIYEEGEWTEARNSIASITDSGKTDVYDLLEVEDVHSFIANRILVHNCVFLDEFAIVPDNIQEEFFRSVFPTISSGKTTKVFIASTPNGMNKFHEIWTKAKKKTNRFVPIDVHWSKIPGRDDNWREEQIKIMGERGFNQEFNTEFLGSSMTLISGSKLQMLEGLQDEPIHETEDGFRFFVPADRNRSYMMVVDTAEGTGNDYSAFVVFDTSEVPYKVVCTFRNNNVHTVVYPKYIMDAATYYNNCWILIETNSLGSQIVDILHHDMEYENLISTAARTKRHEVTGGFGVKSQIGVRTTKTVKRLGCSTLKSMVETDQLDISDHAVYSELTRYSLNKVGSYEAESGNDDLVMCCVLFAWMTSQPHFKDLTNTDVVKSIYQVGTENINDSTTMVPFGIVHTGSEREMLRAGGDLWEDM